MRVTREPDTIGEFARDVLSGGIGGGLWLDEGSKGKGCEKVRLRWKESERELRPCRDGGESAVRDCCTLGRGMALGFELRDVGVALLFRECCP